MNGEKAPYEELDDDSFTRIGAHNYFLSAEAFIQHDTVAHQKILEQRSAYLELGTMQLKRCTRHDINIHEMKKTIK